MTRLQKDKARLVNEMRVEFQARKERIEHFRECVPDGVPPEIDEAIEKMQKGLTEAEIDIITDPRGISED